MFCMICLYIVANAQIYKTFFVNDFDGKWLTMKKLTDIIQI